MSELKVGSPVLIIGMYGSDEGKIIRETKTQWIVNREIGTYEYRFKKSNLREIGNSTQIRLITVKEAESIKLEKRKKEILFQVSKMIPSLIPSEDLETYEKLIYNYHEKSQ